MAAFCGRSDGPPQLLEHAGLTNLDVCHVLAMTVLPEILTRANDDVDTIDASLHRNLDIVHVTSDVRENLGLQSQLADGLAVLAALLTRTRASELDAVDTESIKLLGDRNLGLGVEVGIGELLALAKCRLDDLEI